MADSSLRRTTVSSPADLANCEQCDTPFDLHGLDERTALCHPCFRTYLDEMEVPFLEQYSRFGAKAHRTVAEALLRGLVTSDPDDRKVIGMRIVEEYLNASQELVGLYVALRNRQATPIMHTFLEFELSISTVAIFKALTEGRSDNALLRDLGFPTLTDVESARPEISTHDYKQMRAAIDSVPRGIERVRNVEAGALLRLNDGLRHSKTLAHKLDWMPDRSMPSDQVALLVLEHRSRRLLTHQLSIDEPQLKEFIGAIGQITQSARDLIWLYLHTRNL